MLFGTAGDKFEIMMVGMGRGVWPPVVSDMSQVALQVTTGICAPCIRTALEFSNPRSKRIMRVCMGKRSLAETWARGCNQLRQASS